MIALTRPAICLVTDRRRLVPDARTIRSELAGLAEFLDDAIDVGVDLIQIREHDLEARALLDVLIPLVNRARAGLSRILVNDRLDVAMVAGADGIHLRADGPPVGRVRSLSDRWVIGRSVHEGDVAERYPGADYLIFGTVFPTVSKEDATGTGLDALRAMTIAATQPVLAIGGITPARAGDCCRAGAAGIAAIGIFLPEGRAPQSLGLRRAVEALRGAMTAEPDGTGSAVLLE